MRWLAATMPPASIRAVSVKITPARFWMTIVPGARSAPWITLRPAEVTRFSVAEDFPGWSNSTLWSRPTSKPFQSITARLVRWRITVRSPLWLIAALPRATAPPVGPSASAGAPSAASEAPSSSRKRTEGVGLRMGVTPATYARVIRIADKDQQARAFRNKQSTCGRVGRIARGP